MSMQGRGGGVTFDRILEIIRIISELRSQVRSVDIMRMIAASKKCRLFWSRFDFTTK